MKNLSFCENSKKKFGGGVGVGRGSGGCRVAGGVRVDVKEMFVVGGDVGYENQESKVLYNVEKGIVQY